MAAHARALFDGLRDPSLYRWLDDEPPESLAWLEARYARLETRRSADGRELWLNWALWSHADAAHVGTVQATVRPDGVAAVAWVLLAAWQGRGYASEAVSAMLLELRDVHRAASFSARIDARNTRSIALARRLGFEAAGSAGDGSHDLLFRRGADVR